MIRIMRRLEGGERWWAAEILLRTFGLAMLGLCVVSVLWLHGSLNMQPRHGPAALEYAAALAAFLGWSLGWVFLLEGPGLFKLIPVPPRRRRFNLDQRTYR